MTKKTYLTIIISLLVTLLVAFIVVRLTKPNSPLSIFTNTVPLLNQNPSQSNKTIITYQKTSTPPQTNLSLLQVKGDSKLSSTEKDKVLSLLPLRINDFQTSVPLTTTINVYSLPTDPSETLRIEIYNINFNHQSFTGNDALAFKDSFLTVKKIFLTKQVNLKNLEIIYGNRQYIQDTATSWVNHFKLLD